MGGSNSDWTLFFYYFFLGLFGFVRFEFLVD